MSKLRQFLSERKAEIDRQIKDLRDERAEILMAEKALPQADSVPGIERQSRRAPDGGPTLKDMAVAVLSELPDGADANAIRHLIGMKFGREIARESMSPQLSRLGAASVLKRDGLIWKLALPPQEGVAQTNEASGVSPPEASESEEVKLEDLL